MTVYLSSAYLAPVSYYAFLLQADRVVVEQHDHYLKQTYRNRCTIAGPDGPLALTVPIVKPDTPKCPMRDIRISDHGNWRHLHWNAMESAYGQSPFWEYYRDDLRPFYEQRYDYLMDFNEALQSLVCSLIDFEPRVERSRQYLSLSDADILDLREAIHPKRDLSTLLPAYQPVEYYQVFASRLGFLPHLSILDLLCNMGPESLIVLEKTIINKENADDAEGADERREKINSARLCERSPRILRSSDHHTLENADDAEGTDERREINNSARLCERSPRSLRSSDKCLSKIENPKEYNCKS